MTHQRKISLIDEQIQMLKNLGITDKLEETQLNTFVKKITKVLPHPYSEQVVLYIDGLSIDALENTFNRAGDLLSTYACCSFPNKDGIKIWVKVISDTLINEEAIGQVVKYYEQQLGLPVIHYAIDDSDFDFSKSHLSLRKPNFDTPFVVELPANPLLVEKAIPTPDDNSSDLFFKDSIEGDSEDFSEKLLNTPCIPEGVYQLLPMLLQDGCIHFEHPREKDLFLTGALTILSGCMNGVSGSYDQRTVGPNLFSFIIAPAASGKGALSFAKELAMTFHRRIVEESNKALKQYQLELEQFLAANRGKKKNNAVPVQEPPKKPNFRVLFIPANSSSAAVIAHLNESNGIGIICETEADTMGNTLKQDWGGYSDLLRKSFHHEPVTYSRKANNEFVEVENPQLSVVLSGTPAQVPNLILSAEDGLFSRFIFYSFRVTPQWRNVSPQNKVNLTEYFREMSENVELMVNYINRYPTEFHLTENQWETLNNNFDFWLKEVSTFVNEDAGSTVKRLGLITFRIAMILSAIRKFEDGVADKVIYCEDGDFEIAFALADVYKKHALLMFASLPKPTATAIDQNKKRFFDALPNEREFTRQEAIEIGLSINVKERTVDKYLKLFLNGFVEQPFRYGPYRKIQ